LRNTSPTATGATDALMLNNAEWLDELNYIDFLRDIGRHFSINRMLSFRVGQVAARPGAIALVSRIQLHDPAGL
jgi:tyrosyl-tRNA synthetase